MFLKPWETRIFHKLAFTRILYRSSTKKSETITNEVASIEQFCKSLKKLKKPVMVVMEATGGYETILVRALAKHNICAVVVNPRQVRDFAKGVGIDAKTDEIDAKVIARFAEVGLGAWHLVFPARLAGFIASSSTVEMSWTIGELAGE